MWGNNETIILFYLKNQCTSFCLIKFYDLRGQEFFEDWLRSYRYVFEFHHHLKIMSLDQDKHVSVQWFNLKPDWKIYKKFNFLNTILCLIVNWLFITFDMKENREIGLQFFASILILFLNKGFIFAMLHFEGKVPNFIGKFILLER